MRAGKCVLCSAALPEGARRDRRYCGESCRAMAYRKRRVAVTAESGQPAPSARVASAADLAPVVLAIAQQLKQLQEDMQAVKKRLADLEAQALAQPARPTPMVEQAREVVQTLQSIFGAGQDPRKSEPSAPTPTVPAAPEPSVQAPSVPMASASSPMEAATTKLRPWMTASPKDATQIVPQWALWSPEFLDRLNSYVERMLGTLPEVLAVQGETQAAEKIRQWIASDRPVTLQVASLMARRIVATPPAARMSAQQRLDLAQVVTRDIEDSLRSETAEDKQRIAGMVRQEPRLSVLMGVFLTVALRSLSGAPGTSNP